jgi:phosphopantothenate---cysteine ligase (CTP)
MKILVTAGSTQMPIDKVRCISNIFKGRTGTNIAIEAAMRGHDVTLLGNPQSKEFMDASYSNMAHWRKNILHIRYTTFDDLQKCMEQEITGATQRTYDAIIHSAAVSDYKVSAIYDDLQTLEDAYHRVVKNPGLSGAGKIKSGGNLFLHLTPTIKLVDQIRHPWGFEGSLVKFKLQVGISEEELIEIAKTSRAHSDADIIVANSLEFFNDWGVQKMFVVDADDTVTPTSRTELAGILLDKLERGECSFCKFFEFRDEPGPPCGNCRHGIRQFGVSNWRARGKL